MCKLEYKSEYTYIYKFLYTLYNICEILYKHRDWYISHYVHPSILSFSFENY